MIAGLYGKGMFNIVRNHQTSKLSSSVAAPFCIPPSSVWVFLWLHPSHHLVLSVFRILAILIGMQWHLVVVLICISLVTWCGASFHKLFCHICIFFGDLFDKVTFKQVVFLVLSFKSSFHILDNNPLSDITFANIFSRSVHGLLILLIMSSME